METSLFLARLIGPIFIIIGIGLLLNRDMYRTAAEEVFKSRALFYVFGALALAGGLAIVLNHNVGVGLASHHHCYRLAHDRPRYVPHSLSAADRRSSRPNAGPGPTTPSCQWSGRVRSRCDPKLEGLHLSSLVCLPCSEGWCGQLLSSKDQSRRTDASPVAKIIAVATASGFANEMPARTSPMPHFTIVLEIAAITMAMTATWAAPLLA